MATGLLKCPALGGAGESLSVSGVVTKTGNPGLFLRQGAWFPLRRAISGPAETVSHLCIGE